MQVSEPVEVVSAEQIKTLLPTVVEVRVPALGKIPREGEGEELLVAFDTRLEPVDSDWEATGGAMAADLPNPNSLGLVTGELTNTGLHFNSPKIWKNGQIDPKTGFSDPCILTSGDVIAIVHARSSQVGFFGSAGLNGESEQLLKIEVARSVDGGKTWSHSDVSASVYGDFAGIFATSGHGVVIPFPQGETWAVPLVCRKVDGTTTHMTMRSADRGLTWVAGQPIGEDMDETAYGMLDGKLVLSARRTSAYKNGALGRFWAVSDDAGLTWSEPIWDENLPAAACNAALITSDRGLFFAYPGAGRQEGYLAFKRNMEEPWENLGKFTEGACGYVEGAWIANRLVLLYETPAGIYARTVQI